MTSTDVPQKSISDFEAKLDQADKAVAQFDADDNGTLNLIKGYLRRYPTLVPAAVLILSYLAFGLAAAVLDHDSFFRGTVLSTILQQMTIVGLIALVQTIVILTAGIELSVGEILILSALVMANLAVNPVEPEVAGMWAPLAIVIGVVLGGALGFVNGILGSVFRMTDRARMQAFARQKLSELGLMTIQDITQAVESLSGGQRQGLSVARAAAFGSKVVILDEPTAALGVKESRRVLDLIRDVRARGIPIILISHNMPRVFEVRDRVHVHRLGRRLCTIDPKKHTMSDALAYMTGAKLPDDLNEAA